MLREVALALMDSGGPTTVARLMRRTRRSDPAIRRSLRQMLADGRVERQRVEQRGTETWRWLGERDETYGRDAGVWRRPRRVLPEVADAVRQSRRPLTVAQVAVVTGRSEPAVRLALKELLARQQVARGRVLRWSRGPCWVMQWWWTGPPGSPADTGPAVSDVVKAGAHLVTGSLREADR